MFNLDASVSNDDLRQIFGAYGEVKEVQIFVVSRITKVCVYIYICIYVFFFPSVFSFSSHL